MSRRVVLIECVTRRRLPSLPWALIAADLVGSVSHDRFQVHEFALTDVPRQWLGRESHAGGPPALVYLDTRFPVREAALFVRAIAPVPVVFYGPYALDRFEQVPVRAALVGPSRGELSALGRAAVERSGPPHPGDYRGLPRFLIRQAADTGTVEAVAGGTPLDPARSSAEPGSEERWTATSAGPWPTAETVMRPLASALEWEYIGPRRREDPTLSDRAVPWWPAPISDAPSIVERESARLPLPRSDEAILPHRFDRRWSPESVPVLQELLERDPEAELFRFEPGPRAAAIALLVDQVRVLARLGHRSLEVTTPDPSPLLLPWLRELARTDLRPHELVLSPSSQVLRRSEGIRQELLGALQLCDRLTLRGIEFSTFDDRSLRLRGLHETHWDQRWVARLLSELDGSFDGRISATSEHRLALFDPWIRPPELLESLVAIEEDAPFLKAQVHPDASLRIPSRHGPMGRRIDAAGLLGAGPSASGWDYEFEDPRIRAFRDLCQQGLGPLVESVGRLRLTGEARQGAIVEARFRWFRQLAELFESDPEGCAHSWGKVLASVTRQIAVDVRRG